jgi:hypothetical protein
VTCFFAGWPGAGPCDGRLIKAHLIPRQLLRREYPDGAVQYVTAEGRTWARWRHGNPFGEGYRTLKQLIDDERCWIPCCGGPMGPSGHHGQLDYSCTLRIPREKLPPGVEEFAAELGLSWYLDRTYGRLAGVS